MKILKMTDEFTREALATNAARHITSAGTMAVLGHICESRGGPQFLRMDYGPEFVADTLRDRCKEEHIPNKLLRRRLTLVKRSDRVIHLETQRRTTDQRSV